MAVPAVGWRGLHRSAYNTKLARSQATPNTNPPFHRATSETHDPRTRALWVELHLSGRQVAKLQYTHRHYVTPLN